MKNVLFDQASANLDSPTFEANGQVTIIGMGLQDGDYITFEVVNVVPGAIVPCGCRISTLNPAQIAGTLELICPVCETDTVRPVRLTERNPVVVIDFPQNTLLRAIYHGDGIDLRTVNVWAENTSTPDLTDAMRGCPPVCCEDEPQTWVDTGVRRCVDSTTEVEVQEVSNCGNLRWVTDTSSAEDYWVPTGPIRCGATFVENLETNPCGRLRWEETTELVTWTNNGAAQCDGATVVQPQINNCGQTRNFDTGVPVTWTNNGALECDGATVTQPQINNCGQTRNFDTGTPVTWTNNGALECSGPGGTLLQPQINNCGQTRMFNTGVACEEPCVPNWQPTGEQRCFNDVVQDQEADGCGNTRWVDTAESCAVQLYELISLDAINEGLSPGAEVCWEVAVAPAVVDFPLEVVSNGGDTFTIPVGAESAQVCKIVTCALSPMTVTPGNANNPLLTGSSMSADVNPAPFEIQSVTVDPTNVDTGDTVTFTMEITPPNSGVAAVVVIVNPNDGGPNMTFTFNQFDNTAEVNRVFANPGTFNATYVSRSACVEGEPDIDTVTVTGVAVAQIIDISSPPGEVDPGDQICYTVTTDIPAGPGGLAFNVTVSGDPTAGGNVCGSYDGSTSGPVLTTLPGTVLEGQTTAVVCYDVPGA